MGTSALCHLIYGVRHLIGPQSASPAPPEKKDERIGPAPKKSGTVDDILRPQSYTYVCVSLMVFGINLFFGVADDPKPAKQNMEVSYSDWITHNCWPYTYRRTVKWVWGSTSSGQLEYLWSAARDKHHNQHHHHRCWWISEFVDNDLGVCRGFSGWFGIVTNPIYIYKCVF